MFSNSCKGPAAEVQMQTVGFLIFFRKDSFIKAPVSHQCGLEWFSALYHYYSSF